VKAVSEKAKRAPSAGVFVIYVRMPEPGDFRATSTVAMAGVMIVIGIALIVRTLAAGGGPFATGLILGVLFVVAGAGRIYLRRRLR